MVLVNVHIRSYSCNSKTNYYMKYYSFEQTCQVPRHSCSYLKGSRMETMDATGHGLYRHLWAVCTCSNQRRTLIWSWVMPPTTGAIEIERGGGKNITINHGCGGGDCGGGGNSNSQQKQR